MRWKWSHLLMTFAMATVLIVAGCADEDDGDNGGGPGPTARPLVGTWNGTSGSVSLLGLDEMSYFLRTDSTYLFYQRAASTEIRETGTWRSSTDSIYFNATMQDSQQVNNNYARWYDLSANEDTLRVRYLFDQLYTVTFIRQ